MNYRPFFDPSSAPQTGDHLVPDAAVHARLDTAIAAAQPLPVPLRKHDRVRIIRAALDFRPADPATAAVSLRLVSAVPTDLRDLVAIIVQKCRLLFILGELDLLVTELRRGLRLNFPNPAHRELLLKFADSFGMGWAAAEAGGGPTGDARRWPRDPREWYFGDKFLPSDDVLTESAVQRLLALRGHGMTPEFSKGLARSAIITRRDAAMERAVLMVRHASTARDPELQDLAANVIALESRARSELVVADTAPLQAEIDAGRNVMVLRVHAGPAVTDSALTSVAARRVIVGIATTPREGFEIVGVSIQSEATLGLLKLAKSLRGGGNLVLILPDGGVGQDFGHLRLSNATMTYGRGAVALARMHDTRLFFGRSILRDGKFHLELTPGALVPKGAPIEEAEAAVCASLGEGVQKVLHGAPEDMGALQFVLSLSQDGTPVHEIAIDGE